VAFTLLPDLRAASPYVTISGHGLALWVTTPALLLLLWPHLKNRLHAPLLLTVAGVAGWILLYQNSGWLQFGFRFSLDHMVLLVVLLAIGGRPLTRLAKALIVIGIVVNLCGAITFARMPQFYGGNDTYDCVVPH
jgi:multisubunit Na+/H+ antiporter MnhG subunit